MQNDAPVPEKTSEEQRTDFHSILGKLAGNIGREDFPAGDRASLRRMRPGETWPPAFWRLLLAHVPDGLRQTDEHERAWAVIMQGLAIMAPGGHDPNARLGRVMADIGGEPMEQRLLALVRATGERLEDEIRMLARRLASADVAVNWHELGKLAWNPPDSDKGEALRRTIARDFFSQRHRQDSAEDK